MNIAGIGIDVVNIERFGKAVDKHGKHFLKKIFTQKELEYAAEKKGYSMHMAGKFAAKEAVSKALGTGFRQGVMLRDIETIHQESGKPEVLLHGGAALVAKSAGISSVHLSLTDDDGVAMAFAIAES